MARKIAALLALFCLLSVSPAWADASSELGLTLLSTVSGRKQPAIVIQPERDVRSLVVALKRNDGRKLRVSARNVAAGSKRELAIRQKPGAFNYDGHFVVKWGSGEKAEFDMRFAMTRVQKLKMRIVPEDVDLDARTMSFTINNPAARAELIVMGKDKRQLLRVSKDYRRAPGGTRLDLSWRDPGGDILYMDLKVYDVAGFWKGVRLTPFTIAIPHDDVQFAFGKWAIRKSEEPKLKATMGHIRDALREHGTLLTLKLYIAGYTDTVGSKAANDRLSRNRARSIARWFRRSGLKIPISYQGFGEQVLAKPTPDETPEPANRRALYILSSQQPTKSGQIPKDDWKKL